MRCQPHCASDRGPFEEADRFEMDELTHTQSRRLARLEGRVDIARVAQVGKA